MTFQKPLSGSPGLSPRVKRKNVAAGRVTGLRGEKLSHRLIEKLDCSGSNFKSQFSIQEIAAMKRRHALTHPWQRGYRNHSKVKEAMGAK